MSYSVITVPRKALTTTLTPQINQHNSYYRTLLLGLIFMLGLWGQIAQGDLGINTNEKRFKTGQDFEQTTELESSMGAHHQPWEPQEISELEHNSHDDRAAEQFESDEIESLEYDLPEQVAHRTPINADIEETNASENPSDTTELGQNQFRVSSGVNLLLPIAINHLNRIETPFVHPEVKTSSEAAIEIEGNVLYVLVTHNEPVSLFISEAGDPGQTLSITLIAKRIPPRIVQLALEKDEMLFQNRWQVSVPQTSTEIQSQTHEYISRLKSLLATLARNQLPKGYILRRIELDPLELRCQQAGIERELSNATVLIGTDFIVYITQVTNRTNEKLELRETDCHGPLIAAVSFYPERILLSGQSTQMLIVSQRQSPNLKAGFRRVAEHSHDSNSNLGGS